MATDPLAAPDPAPLDEGGCAEPRQALMARLYAEHNQALINFLLTRVDSEAEARDCAQEAYVRMLQLDQRGAISFLSGYLFRTAANIAIDRARSRAVQRRIADGLGAERAQEQGAAPEQILEACQELELIDRFVEELPAKCRQAFYLDRLHGMSPPDIAARLGVSVRMVHLYLVKALAHLHSRLTKENLAQEKPE